MISGKSHSMASPLGFFFGLLLLLFSCCHPLEENLGTGKGEGSAGWRLRDARSSFLQFSAQDPFLSCLRLPYNVAKPPC